MKKSIFIAGAMLVLGVSAASAAGINLSWTDCGAAGTPTTTFLCNSNTGLNTLIGSFVPPAGIDQFLGLSGQIDITVGTNPLTPLPAWWQHGGAGCRGTTGLSTSFDFTGGPFSCADFFGGQAAGGFAYDIGFGTQLNRARLRITCAVPFDNRGPVDPATEYYAVKVNLLHAKTVGAPPTGCNTGCSDPACIVLNEIQLFQPPESLNDPDRKSVV